MAIPFARSVARFNTRFTNRILGPITWYLPGFGRVEHVGRRTGSRYDTPMMAFPSPDGLTVTFALTYGPGAHWVRNVMAAGAFTYRSRKTGPLRLAGPRLVHDPQRRAVPWVVGRVLWLLRVDDFLVATVDR